MQLDRWGSVVRQCRAAAVLAVRTARIQRHSSSPSDCGVLGSLGAPSREPLQELQPSVRYSSSNVGADIRAISATLRIVALVRAFRDRGHFVAHLGTASGETCTDNNNVVVCLQQVA